jgi:hypothetical protein
LTFDFPAKFAKTFFTKRQKPTGERVLATLPFSISVPEPGKISWRTTGAANLKPKRQKKQLQMKQGSVC